MSSFDALFGKVFSSGSPIELGGGLNFKGAARAVYNTSTKQIDVIVEDVVTTTSADFVQPAVGGSVTVSLARSDALSVGLVVFVSDGGYYEVIAVPDDVSATLENLGYDANVAPGQTVPSGSSVTPSGPGGTAIEADSSLDITSGRAKVNTHIVLTDQPWGATTRQGTAIATTVAGNAVVTLDTAGDFQDGDSIVIPGAGGNPALATPAAPTVQQFGTAGARTRSYKVVYMTLEGGYSAPSTATTITDGPATCSTTAGVKVFVPRDATSGAAWAIVYEQLDGAGSYLIKAVTALAPHLDQSSETFVPVAHIISDGTVDSRYGLPVVRISTSGDRAAPAAGAPNFHRARIVSGGGTTSLTLDLAPASTVAGAQISHCNWLPWRDAMLSFGGVTEQSGGGVELPKGSYRFCKNLHVDRPVTFRGRGAGRNLNAPTQLFLVDGYGIQIDDSRTGEKWCPAGYNRVGDRVNALAPGGLATRVFECTTAGYSATTEPTWNTTNGATTADGTAVWTTRTTGSTGFGAELGKWTIAYTTSNFPPLPWFSAWRNPTSFNPDLASNNNWAAATAVALNVYRRPTTPNGFVYKCTTSGTTGGAEPNWAAAGKLKNGATITDNTVVWTAFDCRQHQGACILLYTRATVENFSIDTPRGNGIALRGGAQEGTNVNNSVISRFRVVSGYGGGIVTEGQDTNTCTLSDGDVSSCAGFGYSDQSFLGNTWIRCHAAANGSPGGEVPAFSYGNISGGTQSGLTFVSCYEESGQAHEFVYPALDIGGTRGGSRGALDDLRCRAGVGTRYSPVFRNDGSTGSNGVTFSLPNASSNDGWTAGTDDGFCDLRSSWGGNRWSFFQGSNSATGLVYQLVIQGVRARGMYIPRLLLGPDEKSLKSYSATPSDYAAQIGDILLDTSGAGMRIAWTALGHTGSGSAAWTASTFKYSGERVFANSRVYVVKVNGTTAAGADPTAGWSTVTGAEITDGTITWECRGPSDNNIQAVANPSSPAGTAITDGSQTLHAADGSWHTAAPGLFTSNRTTTCGTTGVTRGDQKTFTRLDTSANTWAIANGGGGGGTLLTFPASKAGFAVVQFDGTDWKVRQLASFG